MIVQSSNVDPITMEVVQNALGAIADEMALIICVPPIPPSCVIHGLFDGRLRSPRTHRRPRDDHGATSRIVSRRDGGADP